MVVLSLMAIIMMMMMMVMMMMMMIFLMMILLAGRAMRMKLVPSAQKLARSALHLVDETHSLFGSVHRPSLRGRPALSAPTIIV